MEEALKTWEARAEEARKDEDEIKLATCELIIKYIKKELNRREN